jgi:uncharacterized protein
VVVVNGPRQAGKTSLLRLLQAELGGEYQSLDDATVLRAARSDPAGFVLESGRPTFIDEVQRGGDPLVLAVKSAVDRVPTPGQFILAGSTRFLFEPRLSESLAGRAVICDLWPFSQGEIEGRIGEDFVSRAFRGVRSLLELDIAGETRARTFERVCRGGLPEAVPLSGRNRRDFMNAYLRTLASRDIVELGRVPEAADLPRLLRVVAARTAQEWSSAAVSRSLGVTPPVVDRLLGMLENLFLFQRIPAWSSNLTAKAVRKPKLHMVDSGLAAVLLGVDADRLRQPTATMSGALLESFVVGELTRQLGWSDTDAGLFHWRDRDGAEVDVVIEQPNGEVLGIEVKAALDVDRADTKGLRILRDRLGDRFQVGIVLHFGDRPQFLEDGIVAVPINALWAC